jgi:hypothetical protein
MSLFHQEPEQLGAVGHLVFQIEITEDGTHSSRFESKGRRDLSVTQALGE